MEINQESKNSKLQNSNGLHSMTLIDTSCWQRRNAERLVVKKQPSQLKCTWSICSALIYLFRIILYSEEGDLFCFLLHLKHWTLWNSCLLWENAIGILFRKSTIITVQFHCYWDSNHYRIKQIILTFQNAGTCSNLVMKELPGIAWESFEKST